MTMRRAAATSPRYAVWSLHANVYRPIRTRIVRASPVSSLSLSLSLSLSIYLSIYLWSREFEFEFDSRPKTVSVAQTKPLCPIWSGTHRTDDPSTIMSPAVHRRSAATTFLLATTDSKLGQLIITRRLIIRVPGGNPAKLARGRHTDSPSTLRD